MEEFELGQDSVVIAYHWRSVAVEPTAVERDGAPVHGRCLDDGLPSDGAGFVGLWL